MIGNNSITSAQIETLRAMVNYTCQNCQKNESEVGKLFPHRIIRGNAGGLYSPNNILMICNECHKKLHQGEFA
jgi:5-methylcytosine-specific restriction endonuclease McrA